MRPTMPTQASRRTSPATADMRRADHSPALLSDQSSSRCVTSFDDVWILPLEDLVEHWLEADIRSLPRACK